MLRRRRQALRVQGQLPEGGSEEVRLRVDLQHFARHPGHHHAAPLPERVPVVGLHQEGPERVGDLVAHVRVGDVQAGENVALHLVPRLGGLGHALAAQHVGEDDRGGHDELHLLPTLLDQRPALRCSNFRNYVTHQLVCSLIKSICLARKHFIQKRYV